MLVNLQAEKLSSYALAVNQAYWAKDNKMLEFIEKHLKTKHLKIKETEFEGIMLSNLNPHLYLSDTIKIEEFPQFLEFPEGIDKKDKKLAKLAYQPYSEFWTTPLEEYKAMTESEQKAVRKHSKTKFYFNNYGVIDSPKQLKPYLKALKKLENQYVVFMCPIFKNQQPSSGGWRWHKWGEYLGTQKPTCEYLYDEPNIELVYVFKIVEIISDKTVPDYSNEYLDFFITPRSLIIKNKQNEYVESVVNKVSNNLQICYIGRYEKGQNPIKIFNGKFENNIPQIMEEFTQTYLRFLNTGKVGSLLSH